MKTKTSSVVVREEVTTVVSTGKTDYVVNKGINGASLSVGDSTVVIPVGEAGEKILLAIAKILQTSTPPATEKPKRIRRTKAQIEAEKADA